MSTFLSTDRRPFPSVFCIFFLFSFFPVYSQEAAHDLLVKKDGKILEVNIVEIKPEEVLYRKKGEPDGPIYAIVKDELLSAKLRNGETVSFTISVDHFYDSRGVPATAPPVETKTGELYAARPPKNEFQKQILDLPSDRLNHNYWLYRTASKKGKQMGFAGTAIQLGVNLIGTVIIAANSDTDMFGNVYSTNPSATRTGVVLLLGGTATGLIMGPAGFIRAAKNGNKARFIRDEMRRRGVPVQTIK